MVQFMLMEAIHMATQEPVALDDGTERTFLRDGDTLTLYGAAKGDGYRVGFGACAGTVLPAVPQPDWTKD